MYIHTKSLARLTAFFIFSLISSTAHSALLELTSWGAQADLTNSDGSAIGYAQIDPQLQGSSGTGRFDSFLHIHAGNVPVEEGFNTNVNPPLHASDTSTYALTLSQDVFEKIDLTSKMRAETPPRVNTAVDQMSSSPSPFPTYLASLAIFLLSSAAHSAIVTHNMTTTGDQVNFTDAGYLSALAYVPSRDSSSGTGQFPSFLKLGTINSSSPYKDAPYYGSVTEGYNTNNQNSDDTDMYQDAQFNGQPGSGHTKAVLLADIPTVKIQNRAYIGHPSYPS